MLRKEESEVIKESSKETEQEQSRLVDKRYYSAAAAWDEDINRGLRRSRNLSWIMTGVMAVIAVLSTLSLVLLLPLKTFEPYMVAVDKTTGYLEVVRALKPGDLSANEAVTAANVVRYVKARETYDPYLLKINFDLANLLSTGEAADDLVREFTPSNAKSKAKTLGDDTVVKVGLIKTFQLLNPTTAQIRFSTETRRNNTVRTEHWQATVYFRYTSTPMKNEYRFDNPLGFQVIRYSKTQESAPTEAQQ